MAENSEDRERPRGRFKVFLGAAPGVGKTCAMLAGARALAQEGADVVVGFIETHGFRDVEALLEGLEILPCQSLDLRGNASAEMDLDAVLGRRPSLILVDDLAHVNAAGSRHVKRWQDVEEILDAGIDVYATLNVHHLESLNDAVERIAGIRVNETIPDSVLHKADDIELIDLPPPELIKRLREGKVFVPETFRFGLHQFFSTGALAALREMALRQTAERVDEQMLLYMRAHRIDGPWPAGERILACIGPDAQALRIVRTAARAADRHKIAWMALHVETGRHIGFPEEGKDRISKALRLAEQLGAEIVLVQGERVAEDILDVARSRNVSQIIVGRSRRRRWFGQKRSVTEELLAFRADFDVLVVAGDFGRPPRSVRSRPALHPFRTAYGAALIAVAAATVFGLAISHWLPHSMAAIAYLMGVLIVASRFGLMPAIVTSIASFLAFNFFFTEPRYSFTIADVEGLVSVIFFLGAAVIASNLAARLRTQVDATRVTVRRTANLYDFNRRISAAIGQDDVLWAVVHHVASTIGGHSLVLMPNPDGQLEIMAGYPPEDRLDDASMKAAQWTWRQGRPAGKGAGTMPDSGWLFLPMKTGRGPVGVLGVQVSSGSALLSPEMNRLLETLVDQAAVAIERTSLVADIEKARVATETERLRAALLSSLSHDLRTPLASIFGAATSLNNYDATLSRSERLELVQTIQEEAERLNRFVQNLLDMTRIGAGALIPRADWVDLADILGTALQRARRMLHRRRMLIELEPGLPLLHLDAVLMEQVFFNLLDNACKYSPDATAITVRAKRFDGRVAIEVVDEGPGIPPADRERVFDMFYRVEARDSQAPGTGLGLAICRGIVEAHGGTISALTGTRGEGTAILISLPAAEMPELPETSSFRDSLAERP